MGGKEEVIVMLPPYLGQRCGERQDRRSAEVGGRLEDVYFIIRAGKSLPGLH